MSRLTELISRIKSKDPQAGIDLEREFKVLSSRREFGLNFERHRPEEVELPRRAVRKGDKVRILPKRGSTVKGDQQLWLVKKIYKIISSRVATLQSIRNTTLEAQDINVEDLVVVAEFNDYIYPGLISTGKVERAKGKPFHTVINGENYHALKALTFTHKGKIDAIYIDPPYNTGARDWKYNNDYVEADDLYRHSKWLAFMERRLLLTKELLNPADSVLIVTIDEKEYLRLGLLLEQVFPDANIQMISVTISPRGTNRPSEFSRVDEYVYFVFVGDATPESKEVRSGTDDEVRWQYLRRDNAGSERASGRPNQFYPIFVSASSARVVEIGAPLNTSARREETIAPAGTIAVFPVKANGTEMVWGLTGAALKKALEGGFVRVAPSTINPHQPFTISFVSGLKKNLSSGVYKVVGKREDGRSIVVIKGGKIARTSTVWRDPSHDAGAYGTSLLGALIPNRKFPFPKSLFAVEDSLRVVTANKPEAIVLDFFAGSGTTIHAVMRLNKQDGGKRQCISVTNNEVGSDEQKALREKGLRPSDSEWERWGICDYITKPRVEAAITGKTPDGNPINGDYKFIDEFPMSDGFDENAEFFTLTYETPISINHNLSFERVSPLLWMRAGSIGRRIISIPKSGWEIADSYGLIVDLDKSSAFCNALAKFHKVKLAYIVTNDDRRFQSIASRLPSKVEPVRLYESYLKNFQFISE